MYMAKSKIMFWVFTLVASAVIALGFCLLFFGTKNVDIMPSNVRVEKIDGHYYMTTEFNAEYGYQFRIEQDVDGKFVLVDTVESKTNLVKLSECDVLLEAGQLYRFSARYITENGASDTDYCDGSFWKATWQIENIDGVSLHGTTLSWEENGHADYYVVSLVNTAGVVKEYVLNTNYFDFNVAEVGAYKAYVSACSNNPFMTKSTPTGGIDVVVVRKNVVGPVTYDGKDLTIFTTEKIEKFSFVLEHEQVAVVDAGEYEQTNGKYKYVLKDAKIYMQEGLMVKSLATKYVLESELVLAG